MFKAAGVNDMVMPRDLVDRDIPVKIEKDGLDAVADYILSMIRRERSGNGDNFSREYFRPAVPVRRDGEGEQRWVIYRTGPASVRENPDLYSVKKSTVSGGMHMELSERAAFGVIVLSGHGTIQAGGRAAVPIESASMFPDRDTLGGDEFFVSAEAARRFTVQCTSIERLAMYQHFASGSNPETRTLAAPEYVPFVP